MDSQNGVIVRVEKFGGTAVGKLEKQPQSCQKLAEYLVEQWISGIQVVPVVSAMAAETNQLISLAKLFTDEPDAKALDMMLMTGEIKSAAMTAIAINELCRQKGINLTAEPLSAYQMGLITSDQHGNAEILEIQNVGKILELLQNNIIPVCAGFQGITRDGKYTTLGRGASDLTAIALAAGLKTDCVIRTDVDGVFTANPAVLPNAKKFRQIDPILMLQMALFGSKVLMDRCVELAYNLQVPMRVQLSPTIGQSDGGTLVWKYEYDPASMELNPLTQTTMIDIDVDLVVVSKLPNKPMVGAAIFKSVTKHKINVVDTVQGFARETADITFTVKHGEGEIAKKALEGTEALNVSCVEVHSGYSELQVYDTRMRGQLGWMERVCRALGAEKINIDAISTSSNRIVVIVALSDKEKAALALAKEFDMLNQ